MAYRFIQARNFTAAGRTAIDLIVLHTMEAPQKGSTAENVANWFAGASAPQASAHYCIDNNSIVQCVRDRDVAWHAPGANHDGLGFEHAGFARFSAAEWANDYNQAMLARSATLAAEKCDEYGIPAVWLSPAELRAGKRGLTSHNNVSQAWHRSTHTDPGPNFPVPQYLSLVKARLGKPATGAERRELPPTLRKGAQGWQVKRLQRLLAAHGFDPGPVDGAFGPGTAVAVKAFQTKAHLTPDGIVGPRTWNAVQAG